MDAHVHEWLHLLVRWAHVMAAIMWIGDSFLFMWLDRALVAPDPPRDGITGTTWLLHGGGYYTVEKRMLQPGKLPPVLHWFKWESASTWLTGMTLLLVVFYLGGADMLVDAGAPHHLSASAAIALGLGTLALSWLVYDAIWSSPLGKAPVPAALLCLALFTLLSYALTRLLAPRAAYMHLGAALGTVMVANVWMRILPPQRRMLARVRAGEAPDPAPGLAAKKRSTHNTYLTLPVLFLMVSNHFPTTYGSRWSWLVVVLLGLAGAAMRHFMLVRTRRVAWMAGAAVALYALTAILTSRG